MTSWIEIISKSKSFTTFSRLSRFTLKYELFIFLFSSYLLSKSSIFLHSKSINNMTKRFFITRFNKTSYFTMQNLYNKFHEKFKSSNLIIIQNSLSFAFSSSMRIRQMRITSYFKSTINKFTNQIKLISNKKHVDLKISVISIWIDHLTLRNSYDNHFIKSHHIYRDCTQHFISRNMLHKHLRQCFRCIMRWLNVNALIFVENLNENRHTLICITMNFFFVINTCWITIVVIVDSNTLNLRLESSRRRQNHENAIFFRFLWTCCYETNLLLIELTKWTLHVSKCFRTNHVNILRITIFNIIHIILITHAYNI